MTRMTITLPGDHARAIERIRRRRRLPRSRVIQEAVAHYLSTQAQQKAVRAYERGYLRKPERAADAEAAALAAAEVLEPEDWT
jgi:predicted transcriptional regulator